MATGSLYGSVSESTGLYGIGSASGGTYFEWFIFQDSATAPATPTGGTWNFSNNTGTAPTGWVISPPPAPVNQVWVSIAVVDSRNVTTFTWSVPGLMTGSGLPILSASGIPSAGTGMNGQLYINTATTPQSLYFKQSGAWTQLTGSTLYATAGANSNITSLTGLTGGISTPDFVQFDTGITPTTAVGKLQWDPTHGGLQVGMVGGNVNLQVGQEEVVYVFNDTASQINEGQVVKITGSQGQRVTVALAQANNDGNSATILGMATENIANNSSGFVTTQGIVNNINTNGFADGTVVYLSPTTPGGFTATKPVAPNHMVLVGYIVKGNSGGAGSIFIHPQNGYELNELHDVLITSVANNNLLRYNSAVPAWVNIAGPTGTIVGTTDTQTLTNKTISGASNTLTNIGNASLSNSSITVNGSAIALGSSANISAVTPNSLSFGTGLSATGPFNGSAAASVELQAVGTAGVYGSAGQTPTITTNSTGQITSITLNNTTVNSANIIGAISVNAANITGVLPIASGGTNASTASQARNNLGLGTIAIQDANNVSITGGSISGITDLAIADGGTGASTPANARTNLGLGTIATQNANNVTITGGSITNLFSALPIASGGTGASSASEARTNLGLGTIATFNAAVPNGAATLDEYGYLTFTQIPPTFVSGASYRGTWNASTNTPTLVSSVGTQGYYYVVATAGSTTLNGISSWAVGDWVIFNGSVWQKITQNTIISGGSINNTPIGATTPSTGNFTSLAENSSPAVVQTDIGTAPNEIPLNQYLGNLAYQDAANIAGDLRAGSINNTPIGATTASTGAFTTLSATGNTTLGDASTDTVTVNGYMGVGGAASAGHGIYFNSVPNSSTFASAVTTNFVFPATTTSYAASFQSNISAIAGSYTTPNVYGFVAGNMGAVGAGATVTNLHGFYVADQTRGTNNYGITSLVSSGSNKWNIYASGTANNYFAGNIGLGVTPSAWRASQKAIEIGGTFSGISGGLNTLLYSNVYTDSSNVDRYKANGAALLYGQLSAGNHVWSTAPSGTAGNAISFTQAMTLNASGNLGVGVTSPAGIGGGAGFIHVNGGSGVSSGLRITNADTGSTGTDGTAIFVGNAGGAGTSSLNIYNYESAPITFFTAANERMRIDSSGNVGIGTSSPTNRLTVVPASGGGISLGDRATAGSTWIGRTGGGSLTGNTYAIGFVNDGTNSGNIEYQAFFDGASGGNHIFRTNATTERMRLDSSGNLIQTVNTTAATLATNNTLTFSIVDNSTLRISVRGSDGTTRTATVALA